MTTRRTTLNKTTETTQILTMEGKPSLTIGGHPLLIRISFKDIPNYINNSLTIEGNALRQKQ